MEQIIIKHPDGTMALLNSGARVSGVTKAEQSKVLLGADTVVISVNSATPLTFHLGDRIEVFGDTYKLNQLPAIKKTGERKFTYDLTFEGIQYDLIDVQFLLPDNTVLDSFTGDLEAFLAIFMGNLNRVYPGKWVLGVFPTGTEFKTLNYTEKNCLEVLQDFCVQWGTEFEINQTNGICTLNIKTAGVNFPYTFSYGRTGGLYELTRQNVNSKNVVTRLYVYGGSNNLGSKYRHSKLCLPGKGKNASYIENAAAIAAFGVKENTKVYDEIYPNRYGKVTGVGSKYYAFKDTTMSFDLNEKDSAGNTKWLINGVNAKVKFTTGNLAGYEFEIHKYDHATKEIQVVPFTDENGMKFPSETSAAFQFGVEDKYFFTDINLPDTYKTDAEAELLTESTKELAQYSQPQVQYGLSIDQNFIKQFAGNLTVVSLFAVGDYIPVEDADLGVKKSIRITAFTRDLLQPYKYSITLGDSVTQTTITRVISDLQKIDNVITINNLADPSNARRNWRASQEVLANVFDPEGHYYSEKIRPLSVETSMLAVQARSQQFVLQNTILEPNYQGNPNVVKVTGGLLVHYTIADTIKSWQLSTATTSGLVSNTVYYIYARCQKTGAAGNIIFDTVQRTVDSDPIYYYFLLGSLSSVISDADGKRTARLISLTYGGTTINGRFINTGRIQSADGSVYFDLDASEIGGKINFKDGLVSGIIGIGNTAGTNAGMSGNGTASASVRIWAGATTANRVKAPYRVLHNGKLYAEDVEIKGKVTATSGEFRGAVYASSGEFKGKVYATDGEFTGKVTATSGTFEGDIVAKNFKTIGPFQHTISSLTIDSVMGVISNFPYSFMRVTPSSNNQQLLISRGWGSKYEGRIIYIHNTHNSYNIQLINGDYLSGGLGKFTVQPRGTVQLMWSQASNDWIIIDYFQTPAGWKV